MNKRQRKKHHKKLMARFDAKMRDPEVMAKFAAVGADFIRSQMLRDSFVSSIIRREPPLVSPFGTWRELGAEPLTHYAGTYRYVSGLGDTIWKGLCDNITVDSQHVMPLTEVVNCFACLAKEHTLREQAPA